MSAPATTQNKTAPARPLTPPDEQFWERYSPHHEFPLSSVSSVALHLLIIGLLFLVGWVAFKLGFAGMDKPLPVDAVYIGGGGGNPNGVGGGPGNGGDPVRGEAVDPPDPTKQLKNPVNIKDIDPGKADPIDLSNVVIDDKGTRLVNPSGQALEALKGLSEEARKKLWRDVAGKGQGGPGSGGGKDKGKDTGTGPATGDGTGKLSQRQKRVLRWVMIFNTQNGTDYARQLAALGAILAYPDEKNPEQYLVIRDLNTKPIQSKPEDLADIKRIYWIDDKPKSVESLGLALGVRGVPHFVAFFPAELEEKLLRIELDRLSKTHPGKTEDDIEETRFVVERTGGSYEPRLTDLKVRAR